MLQMTHLSGFGSRRADAWVGYSWVAPTIVSKTTGECHVFLDSVNGSDANDGLSTLTPKQTLEAAKTVASSGNTIYVYPGTYTITDATNGFFKSGVNWMFSDGATVTATTGALYVTRAAGTTNVWGLGAFDSTGASQGIYCFTASAHVNFYCKSIVGDGIILRGSSNSTVNLYASEDFVSTGVECLYLDNTSNTVVVHARDMTSTGIVVRVGNGGSKTITARKVTGDSGNGVFYKSGVTGTFSVTCAEVETTNPIMNPNTVDTAITITGAYMHTTYTSALTGLFNLNDSANTVINLDNCKIRWKAAHTAGPFDVSAVVGKPALNFTNDCRMSGDIVDPTLFTITGTYLTNEPKLP